MKTAEAPGYVSESEHWYTRSGEPCYEVMSKGTGEPRPTTLRDARKLNLVPSVSTVIKCANAPGLERWKQEQVLLSALTLPKKPDETEKDWLVRVWIDSKAQAKKAAERGTKVHGAIEGHYKGQPPSEEWWPHVKGVTEKVATLLPNTVVIPTVQEKSFAHTLGFGGKIDLFIPAEGGFVIDFKTKEFGPDDEKQLAWDEHCVQLAAYSRGLYQMGARCLNVFVSVTHPGLVVTKEWTSAELERGWDMFRCLLGYWKAKSKYESMF